MVRIKWLVVLLLWAQCVAGQSSYMVFFRDKDTAAFQNTAPNTYLSDRAITRREKQEIPITIEDFPVTESYIAELRAQSINVHFTSKWKNAALITTSQPTTDFGNLPFVKLVEFISPGSKFSAIPTPSSKPTSFIDPTSVTANTDLQLDMLNAKKLHEDGYSGEGMLIAVLDDGFVGVDQYSPFQAIWEEDRMVATKDFIGNSGNVFQYDDHGSKVFSTIGGHYLDTFSGTAPNSSFVLCVTEDVSSEYRIEEYNWLLAAEYADSLGVDVINSSLGYSVFSDNTMNYTTADLDGKTSVVTQAANLAASKGIVVVVSAGNEGSGSWKYVTSPADAFDVLAVGSVDRVYKKSTFSSVGPTADGRIKPDVCALGTQTTVHSGSGRITSGNGTSFASPQIAGFAACIWQKNPSWTSMEVVEAIRILGNNAYSPDSLRGYGVPSYVSFENLSGEIIVYPNPSRENTFTIDLSNFEFKGSTHLKIIDLQGKDIFERTIPNLFSPKTVEVTLSDEGPGVFFLIVENKAIRKTLKLVKI